MRLAQEIATQESALNDDGVMGDVADLANMDDDKTFAAMNIARTITTVSGKFNFLVLDTHECVVCWLFRLLRQWIMHQRSWHRSRKLLFR